jgi:predicted RNA methylase
MINLCPPAIIYLIFSATQILIDLFKGLYNTAFVKCIVMIMVTLLLNILCEKGLNVVSWIIVFIPFMLMTVIVSIILYIFGLDIATGNLNKNYKDGISEDSMGNIIIYDPYYNSKNNPVYFHSPNLIVPNPHNNYNPQSNTTYPVIIPSGSTSPAYQS